jgi:hypothetical protein
MNTNNKLSKPTSSSVNMRHSSPRLKERTLLQQRTAAQSHVNRTASTKDMTMVLPPPIPGRGTSSSTTTKKATKQSKQSAIEKNVIKKWGVQETIEKGSMVLMVMTTMMTT